MADRADRAAGRGGAVRSVHAAIPPHAGRNRRRCGRGRSATLRGRSDLLVASGEVLGRRLWDSAVSVANESQRGLPVGLVRISGLR